MLDRWNTARIRRLFSALILGFTIASMGATASATVVPQPGAPEASSKGTAAAAIGSAGDAATQQSRWSWLIVAVLIGLAPLAVGTTQVGGDGPPYFPMARAIIGGLAFSTIVSLLVVPAFYAAFDTLSAWGRKVMRTARGWPSLAAKSA